MANIKPPIKRKGSNNQAKNAIKPKIRIRASNSSPTNIRQILNRAPNALKIRFEMNTSRFFPTFNPFL